MKPLRSFSFLSFVPIILFSALASFVSTGSAAAQSFARQTVTRSCSSIWRPAVRLIAFGSDKVTLIDPADFFIQWDYFITQTQTGVPDETLSGRARMVLTDVSPSPGSIGLGSCLIEILADAEAAAKSFLLIVLSGT